FPQRVLALPLPGRLRSEVAPLLAVLRHLRPPLAYSDERIAAVTATDERGRRLQSIPNIGPVPAAAFVAATDEASGFYRPRGRGLPGARPPRPELGRDAAPRPDYQSGLEPGALVAHPSRRLNAPASRSPDGGAARVGGSHQRPSAARVSPWSRSRAGSRG